MKRFVITVTIKSNSEGSTPVDVTWYRGENHAEALAALVQAGAKDIGDESMPVQMRAVVKAVRMDIYDIEEPGATPSTSNGTCSCHADQHQFTDECIGWRDVEDGPQSMQEADMARQFDSESIDYALSDCAWWDEPVAKRPWWAKPDCSGRVGDTEHGVLCEGHFNAWIQ